MKSTEIRQLFLEFFSAKKHEIVESSSLVPRADPTLLFTNAGMNQFKDVFLGKEKRSYTKATTAQRCVRAGGKHNDLENVGYTARHHTFFEMLGNFSFGDYFKRKAILYAWEFLTVKLGLPKERLWITVYKDDQEAESIWLHDVGIDKNRFSKLGEKDNFWSMGDIGPCGPCSEIFYDHGEAIPGDPPGGKNDDEDRYIEIWNMVFMQYNKTADGKMNPLCLPCIDTGMGLERITAVMQGVSNNYDIDIFQHLLKEAAKLTNGIKTSNTSLRVICDHIRSCSFLIADGVIPSNEGRGYTLRRILRRACRHGHKIGMQAPFFYKLVPALTESMGVASKIVAQQKKHIQEILKYEELQFRKTLTKGLALLESEIEKLKGNEISGETVFTLYDTYGFPSDLTHDIAREKGLTIDIKSYEKFMNEQKNRARSADSFATETSKIIEVNGETEFTGYHKLEEKACITGIYVDGKKVNSVDMTTKEAIFITNKTPFYAESGGQIGDKGTVIAIDSSGVLCEIVDTQKSNNHHLHLVKSINEKIHINQSILLCVNKNKRQKTALNHSATHLLHAALRKVLGDKVKQQGSMVDDKRLRFDFSYTKSVTQDELSEIQSIVNAEIRGNTKVETKSMELQLALDNGAIALFNEKYNDNVRVLTMGNNKFSVELCGGTHVSRTGDIGFFVILSEAGIASGVRRIEAITGSEAVKWVSQERENIKNIASILKVGSDQLPKKIASFNEQIKVYERENQQLKQRLMHYFSASLALDAIEINGVKVLVKTIDNTDTKALREIIDQLKQKLKTCIVFLAIKTGKNQVVFATGVTKNITNKIKAKNIMTVATKYLKGKGGGRDDFAQGGGENYEKLPLVISSVISFVKGCLIG